MKKISLEKIVVDSNNNFKDIFKEYLSLKLQIKDSDVKLKQLRLFINDSTFNNYKYLKNNKLRELNEFLLDNPLLGEFIDENNYNILLKDKLETILENKIDLTKLSNGIKCHHEFIKLNGKLLCTKCFIKEEELDFEDDDLTTFLIDALSSQGMYIDELKESELAILENIKLNHKKLIDELKEKREVIPVNERSSIDETIYNLNINATIEYRKSLQKIRNKVK